MRRPYCGPWRAPPRPGTRSSTGRGRSPSPTAAAPARRRRTRCRRSSGPSALGYRYLETDVHATADGVVVAFHDDDLSRTCGRPGLISELPWREVATARVDGREPIPRLTDLLEAWPDARLNIDCKTDRVVGPLADELAATGVLDRVCVGAFSDRRLRACAGASGRRCARAPGRSSSALLRVHRRHQWRGAGGAGARPAGAASRSSTSASSARAHRRGIEVHVWTIDDAAEMARLLDLGVDGIMTDRPAVLRDVLAARGQWVT